VRLAPSGVVRPVAAVTHALVVDGATKRYETREGPITAMEGISFDVAAGEFVSVIGPSGCGKSTLFHALGGLIPLSAGRIAIGGATVRGPHPDIGMVFQEESTFPWRNVLDNVAFPLELRGIGRAERQARAQEMVRLVGLAGFERRHPAELSGGMRQRVAIARTLAAQPKMLLMDEPFAALDEQTRMLLGDKVLQIHQQLRQTTLLITHSLTEAVQLSDRIVVMTFRPGRLKRIFEVHLPRPRTPEVLTSPEFGATVAAVWADLREEASRGLAEAEQRLP
jgi:NitT/TauT family transport system ATP-binding protein